MPDDPPSSPRLQAPEPSAAAAQSPSPTCESRESSPATATSPSHVGKPHQAILLADLVAAREACRNASIEERQAAVGDMLRDEDAVRRIDLRPVMELSPHAVLHSMPLPRVHATFVTLGLRHLYVTDTRNTVVGCITRKDLLPEVLEANAAVEEPFASNGSARHERRRQVPLSLGTAAARRRRHEPKMPAHKHRDLRRASLLRRTLNTLATLSPPPPPRSPRGDGGVALPSMRLPPMLGRGASCGV